mmetsp:Transcript_20918/g.41722  ORF Transcript_20918/g.41722 Transcript_20918/m.41722 type:complete len:233 (-) Transcript_20918:189-887(-)
MHIEQTLPLFGLVQNHPLKNRTLVLLPVLIETHERIAKIDKTRGNQTEGVTGHKSHSGRDGSTPLIHLNHLASGHFCAHDQVKFLNEVGCEGAFVYFCPHIRVQFCQFGKAALGPRFLLFGVLRCQIKIRTEVTNLCRGVVAEADRLGACENNVFRNLHTQPPQPTHKDFHLHQLPHCLHAEGANLATVEVCVQTSRSCACHLCSVPVCLCGSLSFYLSPGGEKEDHKQLGI